MRREHQPEGGSQGGQLRKDGPVQEPIMSTIFCLNYCSGPPPGQAGKQSCGRPLPGRTREPADGQTCAAQISLLQKQLRAGKGPAMTLFGPHVSRHLPAPPESGDQEEAGPGWPGALTLPRQELRAHPRCTAHLWEEASSRCSLVDAST